MKYKIAIIPYATYGRGSQAGHDGYINVFKKKRSTVLKENLEKAFKEENICAEIVVDVNHGDLLALKKDGVNLFVIPEDVAIYLDYKDIDKNTCVKLTLDEYDRGDITKVLEYIKS